MDLKLQNKLENLFEENYEKVTIEENCAIAHYPAIFELSVIAIINTFESFGVKCGEHYFDDEMEDFVIPFIN